MKHKFATSALVLSFLFSACVEVRDKKEADERVQIYTALSSQTIDEPYLFINGQLIPQREFTGSYTPDPAALLEKKEYQLEFEHLFIKERGAIYTMGANIHIIAQEVDALGGLISTYPPGHEAAFNTPGATGGNLKLEIKVARGRLVVDWKGEKGGQGLRGAPPTEDMRGTILPGSPDVAGSFSCGPGRQGFPGYLGATGGDSGTVDIAIENAVGLELTTHISGGEGGRGGVGGAGGLPHRECDRRPEMNGPSGGQGPRGAEGRVLALCEKLGTTQRVCKRN